ncbi:YceI family protein [Flavobacterium sp. UMI-01]|uniref:YceI family protein n=1 Tax=Flavobacterium sp. UMI-01 TaxID=1441053 RepID=UPI001C7DB113|nr:YceI family protein [Flavobacterium sp. UMI-01]GIZ08608.1 lipid-binding protein [Flavobacterium sp. UMI-01]
MKNLKPLLLAFFVLFSFSSTKAQIKKIDVSKSLITWTGKKITGQHEGTIKFKEGRLEFKNNKVIGGNFVADMTTLNNTDQTGSSKAKLEGHLKSDDFFGIYNFDTSLLTFKTITDKGNNVYTIIASLTIKGKSNPIIFDLIVKGNTATANLSVDRTKYDIKYGSGSFFDDLGDKTIYDQFDLKVNLVF